MRLAFSRSFLGSIAVLLLAAGPGWALPPEGASSDDASATGIAPTGVTARLISDAAATAPGDTFLVGVEIKMEEGWHTYWENGGDAGLPTSIEWKLPPGFTAGPILWPVPHRYAEEGDIVTFGYEDRTLLLNEIYVAGDAPIAPASIHARVDWLQCKELCIPGGADVSMDIPMESAPRPHTPEVLATIREGSKQLPVSAATLPQVLVHPYVSLDAVPADGQATVAVVFAGLPGATPEGSVFFPRLSDQIVMRDGTFRSDGESLALLIPIQLNANVEPGSTALLSAVARIGKQGGEGWALSFEVPVPVAQTGQTPQASAAPVFSDDPNSKFLAGVPSLDADAGAIAKRAGAVGSLAFARILLYAFLGGLILNIMPCVLPVISLKILSFVSNANEDPKKIFHLGLMFALGVLTSFLILAAAVISLQAAGERIGWGFQFQSPGFVAAIAAVIFLFSLSLLGVFEINVHVGLWARGGGRAYVDDFMNGMLATLLATPCTAPMLGPAVAFAFTQPPAGIIAIFSAVGMGLALPYVLLTANPKLLRFIPWPGPWMETFKQVMGFVLLATILWLLSVFGAQTGVQGLVRLLAFLMALGILAWLHGRFLTLSSGLGMRVAIWSVTGIVVLLSYQRILRQAIAAPEESELVHATTPSIQAGVNENEVTWAPFSKKALEDAVAAGNTVFLDFTAEWCWTCKVNEKTVLADSEVE
ncbi:MAG TPA: protein-disulfide reductase DsbD domain-containing protein, partial [bacterium]|nr:protein-disulfide reductase DsbD domain-containing protein [bacterium]